MNFKEFCIKSQRRILAYFYKAISGMVHPDSNTVMFFTFQGTFTCNPKYICQKLLEKKPDLNCIWVVLDRKDKKDFPDGLKTVLFGAPEYYRALYRSKVLVDNAFNFVKQPFNKKKGQYLVETMHGSLGIKKIETDSFSNPRRMKVSFLCGEISDFIISNSTFENDVYRNSFWGKTPLLMYGHARCDILHDGDKDNALHNKVRDFYGLPHDAKLALYAPTFSRETSDEQEQLDAELLKDALTQKFGGNWYILKRLHFRDARVFGKKVDTSHVLDGTLYTDIQELMVAIDFAITDYSSWIYDYVEMKKPGMIYAPDLEQYQNSTGFYYPITTVPFPLATNNSEAAQCIKGFDNEKFISDVDAFLKDKGCVDDGKASERAAEMILGLLSDKMPEDAE